MTITNVMTVDVEDMSHSRYENTHSDKTAVDERMLDRSINELLDLLHRSGAKATFFVLGVIARKLPRLVRRISEAGHEVASHGYTHTAVYDLSPEQFRADLVASLKAIEDASGQRAFGFRAPYWSITGRSLWALDIIAECGLQYDSSISPAVNFLYGIRGSQRTAYRHPKGFWEVPPTTGRLMGKLIIIGGGFYLRALPYWITKSALRSLNERGVFGLVYLHPHEIINHAIGEKMPIGEDIILNFNKGSFGPKFRQILKDFSFSTIREKLLL